MLFIDPRRVAFAGAAWDGVSSVAIERRASKTVLEWDGAGPHAVLADVPEQRVTVRVVREVGGDDAGVPAPGEAGTLVFESGPNAGDVARRRVTVSCVVVSVGYAVSARRGATRTVELVGVSSGGAVDPVAVEPLG